MTDDLSLSNLKPAAPRKDRKRIGRGPGSGKGRYSGRGLKGQKARSGSHKMRPGFEGGQMPIHMRVGKQRGATSKDAMPIGPHRTATLPVNVRDLNRFDDGTEVTLELLVSAGVIKNTRVDVKILGQGELTKKVSVTAHAFSATAREKIERAGGSVTYLRGEPKPKKKPPPKQAVAAEPEAEDEPEAELEAEPEVAAEAEAPEEA